MLIGLTGTPGVGKFAVAKVLASRGRRVCHLDALARERKARTRYDARRRTWDVDLDVLERSLPSDRPLVIEGHLSHLLSIDVTVVLRCHPEVLRARLHARGWPASKVEENVEAEALGVITQEALERSRTWEIDTTRRTPEDTAAALVEILEGRTEEFAPGQVDWSEVILAWY